MVIGRRGFVGLMVIGRRGFVGLMVRFGLLFSRFRGFLAGRFLRLLLLLRLRR